MAFTASAQFGRKKKGLSKGDIDAAKKATKAATLSDEDMEKLSLQSVQYMDENNPIAAPGDPYHDRLMVIVKGLEKEDGLTLNFKVYRVVDINAFATPDGSIRVMAGLMDLMTNDEIRSVIGHEIGHVKLKHSKKQYQKAYAVGAGKDAASANSGSAGTVIASDQVGGFVEKLLNSKFSRNDESASDKYGFKFMVKHDYNYHAMETAFSKLGSSFRKANVDQRSPAATAAKIE